jgi:hypothetical protein
MWRVASFYHGRHDGCASGELAGSDAVTLLDGQALEAAFTLDSAWAAWPRGGIIA